MLVHEWPPNETGPGLRSQQRCHSYLRGGKWEYLADSGHAMRGQTVDLPDWPYADGEYGGAR